jgi:hypothetical protein
MRDATADEAGAFRAATEMLDTIRVGDTVEARTPRLVGAAGDRTTSMALVVSENASLLYIYCARHDST